MDAEDFLDNDFITADDIDENGNVILNKDEGEEDDEENDEEGEENGDQ